MKINEMVNQLTIVAENNYDYSDVLDPIIDELKEADEECFFIGMDVHKEVSRILELDENKITNGMSELELKAYRFGVNTTLNILKDLLGTETNFVVNMDIGISEELDLSDLISKVLSTEC